MKTPVRIFNFRTYGLPEKMSACNFTINLTRTKSLISWNYSKQMESMVFHIKQYVNFMASRQYYNQKKGKASEVFAMDTKSKGMHVNYACSNCQHTATKTESEFVFVGLFNNLKAIWCQFLRMDTYIFNNQLKNKRWECNKIKIHTLTTRRWLDEIHRNCLK